MAVGDISNSAVDMGECRDGLNSEARRDERDGPVLLRPHHGMCLAYFIGEGYSEGFSAHMERMLKVLETDAPVRLTVSADGICEACPNNRKGCCSSREKVEAYDRAVLEACRFREGQALSFLDFAGAVQKNVMDTGRRREICGGCQWSKICDHQESRWKSGRCD